METEAVSLERRAAMRSSVSTRRAGAGVMTDATEVTISV